MLKQIGGSSSETTTLDDCLRAFTKQETLDRDEKPVSSVFIYFW